jgi:hypothetical protein
MCTSRVSAHAFKAAYVAPLSRGDHFQFGSVFIKKSNQTDFFLKKPKLVQTDRFRFSFLDKNQFNPVWLGFLGLARFFF